MTPRAGLKDRPLQNLRRRLQVRAKSQQTAIDCEGQWRVASGEKTKSRSLTAVRQKEATGFGMTSLRNELYGSRRRRYADCPRSTGAQPGLALPLGAGPGLKPFACLRFFRTPEQVAEKC